MPVTDLFLLNVGLRMTLTTAFVLGMGYVIARAQPALAAVAIAMPVVIGPGFLILALERQPQFLMHAAEDGLGALSGTVAFAVVVALLAGTMSKLAVLLIALMTWGCIVTMAGFAVGLWGNLAAFALVYIAGAGVLRRAPVLPRRAIEWSPRAELPRALSAGALVGLVTLGAEALGPAVAGTLIALPVGMLFVASGALGTQDAKRTRDVLSAGARGSAALAIFLITFRGLVAADVAPVLSVLIATLAAILAATALGLSIRTSPLTDQE